MQSERCGKHHKPHILCMYDSDEIVIAFDEIRILVEFDIGERKTWMLIHKTKVLLNPFYFRTVRTIGYAVESRGQGRINCIIAVPLFIEINIESADTENR